MQIPSKITAGDTVTWTELAQTDPQLGALTSADWTLSFSFRGPVTITGGDITGTPSGTGWTVTLPATVSAAMNQTAKRAVWYWQAYATNGSTRLTVGSGQLLVDPNFATVAGTLDGRSDAEQILSQINAAILSRTTGKAVAEYTVGGRSLKYMQMTELLQLRSRYQIVVRNERRRQGLKNGLGAGDRVGIRFK
ncbi:MAG TPA: hypothetical protein VFM48_07575 [Aquabacterium sp.]|nr:hypothetical protein [Aquabacterium sp.]